jgi:hypothetical protein
MRTGSSGALLSSFASSNSIESLLQLPAAELQSEVSSSASTLDAVLSLCNDLISRCKHCDQMRAHESELKTLACEVAELVDDSAAASATLDSAIECQARVCSLVSSKFLQLEFRIRSMESKF